MASDKNAARRERILDAAFKCLVARGYRGTTMLDVAREASASKETLYSWFGDKEGLFSALIRRQAAALEAIALSSVEAGEPFAETMHKFGAALYGLLTGPVSVALNRAAISEVPGNTSFAKILRKGGREQTGKLIIGLIEAERGAGRLRCDDPADAFAVFLGLLFRDDQVQALLGRKALSKAQAQQRAAMAVDQLIRLYGC